MFEEAKKNQELRQRGSLILKVHFGSSQTPLGENVISTGKIGFYEKLMLTSTEHIL